MKRDRILLLNKIFDEIGLNTMSAAIQDYYDNFRTPAASPCLVTISDLIMSFSDFSEQDGNKFLDSLTDGENSFFEYLKTDSYFNDVIIKSAFNLLLIKAGDLYQVTNAHENNYISSEKYQRPDFAILSYLSENRDDLVFAAARIVKENPNNFSLSSERFRDDSYGITISSVNQSVDTRLRARIFTRDNRLAINMNYVSLPQNKILTALGNELKKVLKSFNLEKVEEKTEKFDPDVFLHDSYNEFCLDKIKKLEAEIHAANVRIESRENTINPLLEKQREDNVTKNSLEKKIAILKNSMKK